MRIPRGDNIGCLSESCWWTGCVPGDGGTDRLEAYLLR